MIETHSQNTRTIVSWNPGPSRAAGLYGESQPLPLPVIAPVKSTMTPGPAPKSGVTGLNQSGSGEVWRFPEATCTPPRCDRASSPVAAPFQGRRQRPACPARAHPACD